ncbi:hypothetical protein EV193_109117 [Herbihabitans rhizosphaerae]|uniref:Uncharacterized protein n=1 Tax=Herbihabitans rhizosphaerae TaxID=1872711 RepID=A0A4Q7KHE7_9PSEU|nr:hypothetical protein [Herbihabitans rhizosphaerae]RZS34330.1 hypothetical protein EV193_109117 [Herbihabitans rhizosphaerae]
MGVGATRDPVRDRHQDTNRDSNNRDTSHDPSADRPKNGARPVPQTGGPKAGPRPNGVANPPAPVAAVASGQETDSFPTALRTAIQASGLSLDRIQYRLRARGVSVSVTALSYWQSGRRRPERPESLAALGHLEAVLGLAAGSLMALLGPPRPRGRAHRGNSRVPIDALWNDNNENVASLLERVDVSSDTALTRISQHDRATIAVDRGDQTVLVRQVLRAERDGADRWVTVYDAAVPGKPFPEITPRQACRMGRIARDDKAGLQVGEILFDRPLNRGETTVIEYALTFAGPPYPRGDNAHCRKFTAPVREYVVELRFDPRMLPAYVEQFAMDPDEQTTSRRQITVEPNGHAHAVALDFGPGTFGLRWKWRD